LTVASDGPETLSPEILELVKKPIAKLHTIHDFYCYLSITIHLNFPECEYDATRAMSDRAEVFLKHSIEVWNGTHPALTTNFEEVLLVLHEMWQRHLKHHDRVLGIGK
jgi:hypothetical protein